MKILFYLLLITSVFARPSPTVKYVGLRQLGKYSGVNDEGTAYEKFYYISNYLKMASPAARSFCKSFGPNMDLVSFESRSEFIAVRSKFEPEVRDKAISVIVGGFAHSTSSGKSVYHWISSGSKIFSDLEAPNDKACLGIRKDANDPVIFFPISCEQNLQFMCHEMDIQYAN